MRSESREAGCLRDRGAELEAGVAAGQFRLVYQPFATVATDSIVGYEALLRWDRPGGELGPAAFVALAEETGAINALGEWVIGEACRQLAAWRQTRPELVVSVNVSPRQLIEQDVAEICGRELELANLPAGALMVEVTETPLLAETELIAPAVKRLAQFGVRIAMDDFGAGACSLSLLRRLPVDVLKIDRLFVDELPENPGDQVIVDTLLSLAVQLGMGVIAEGVERGSQLRALAALGCDTYQGYLLSPPRRPEDLDLTQPTSTTSPPVATWTLPPKASRARTRARSRSSSSETWVSTRLPAPASRASLPASSALM